MNAHISKTLESILRDPHARRELGRALLGSGDRQVRVGERTYSVIKLSAEQTRVATAPDTPVAAT